MMKTVKELCEEFNIRQTALARRFGIPLRTVQRWALGESIPPDYTVRMMEELLRMDAEKKENTYTQTKQ